MRRPPSRLMQGVLEVLAEAPPAGLSCGAIAERTGKSRSSVRGRLIRLMHMKLVAEEYAPFDHQDSARFVYRLIIRTPEVEAENEARSSAWEELRAQLGELRRKIA